MTETYRSSTLQAPLALDGGGVLTDVTVAYETYGALAPDRSNAILLCHALTGDQFVASAHPVTGKPGWWRSLIGPGKPIDTERFFVICSNVLGGCLGTTGPMDIDPDTGKPHGLSFPVITIGDMVRVQKRLIEHLGIEQLFLVTGGSMGAMQVLEWAARYPEAVFAAAPIAGAARHSAQNIAFNEVARQSILTDPNFHGGRYYLHDTYPRQGLILARMVGHITYLSDDAMRMKFGRDLRSGRFHFGFDVEFQVESYLRHQGEIFSRNFDANTYLLMTKALDYFDPAREHGDSLENALARTRCNFLVMSFNSDWRFAPERSAQIPT